MLLDDERAQHGAEEIVAPELSERQQQEAEERTAVSAVVVHEAIRHDGEEELERPVSALAWSGLAAGLSMGFSLVGQALFRAYLPETRWRPLISNLGYPIGFLIVIIGRQQLFTENTLTAIIPLLARRNMATFLRVVRLWTVVLVANLSGAHLFAWVVSNTDMFKPEVRNAMMQIGIEVGSVSFGTAMLRGVFAGWLIAMVVWMLAAVDSGRAVIIIILTYVVGLASLTHIIAGTVEALFPVMAGVKSWWTVAWGYMLPTLIGNCIGGVSLTAAINHAQVVSGMTKRQPRTRLVT
jgi:formate/nitrite transporter FocA (FNT family)